MTFLGLEAKLGYRFSDPSLSQQALTHRSFGIPNNERLEFLGDSVLNCAIAQLLYRQYRGMPEGELSRLRSNLVNQAVLADISLELGIGQQIRLGEGELKTGGASRPSILADAVEALLGAVFLDGGFDAAAQVVATLYAARIGEGSDGRPHKDAKTALQEWLQARRLPLPQYMVVRIEGEAHRQTFQVRCEVESKAQSAVGHGASRRAAEQDAAAQILALIETQEPHRPGKTA